jgi:AraC-like DNA-binding protein
MIIDSVFQGGDLPAEDRLDGWREFLSETHAPVDVRAIMGDFDARQRIVQIGAVGMVATSHFPAVVHRSRKLVRQSDPEAYYLGLPLSGTTRVTHSDHQFEYSGEHFVFHDSTDEFTAETGHYESVSLGIPKAALAFPGSISGMPGIRSISATEGIGALLATTMTRIADDIKSYRPADVVRLGTVVVDLVTALFAHVLETGDAIEPRVQTTRIRAFIEQHLADPGLTPGAVADAHHISVSYLHRLFQQEEVTVAALIRRQRLERARRDLTDPALLTTPVYAIGNRWGYPRAADFTRAFRLNYGVSPRDYRGARIAKNL